MTLRPSSVPREVLPSFMVEIVNKNQSWQMLQDQFRPNTNVQVTIGVQICRRARRIAIMRRSLDYDPNRDHARHRTIFEPDILEAGNGPLHTSFPMQALYQNSGQPVPIGLQPHALGNVVINLSALLVENPESILSSELRALNSEPKKSRRV